MFVFPLSVTGNPSVSTAPGGFRDNLFVVENWQHTISARGGFTQASFSLYGPMHYLKWWFDEGLAWMLTRHDHTGRVMWQGYIHSVTLTMPDIQVARTLEGLANRVYAIYTPTDFSDCAAVNGETTITAAVQDTDSQSLYGISEHALSAGQATPEMAEAERYIHLTKYGHPPREVRSAPGGNWKLDVECRGYGEWFKRRYYSQTTTVATANASTVITNVVNAIGQYINGVETESNTFQVQNFYDEIELRTAWEILNAISDKGDGANLWNWGIWENRRFKYRRVPAVVDYIRSLGMPDRRIYTYGGTLVYPWQLRPDRFIRTADSFNLNLKRHSSDYTRDPTVQYIYSVTWAESNPFDVQVEYRESGTLKSALAESVTGGGVY